MLLKTLLNRLQKYKSFVYEEASFVGETIEISIRERKGSLGECSYCGYHCSCYDHLPKRRYEFVPIWGVKVFFVYKPRRVSCPSCGVKVEKLPWCQGKQRCTTVYKQFLSFWGSKMSWQEVANLFQSSWQTVYRSIADLVEWGLEHRDLSNIKAIGVDEIYVGRYYTLVYQIDKQSRRLLWIHKDRTEHALGSFFTTLSKEVKAGIEFVCSDMHKPYIKILKQVIPQAVHVLDRFHIVLNINKALDQVRKEETIRLKEDGYEPALTGSRWCFLKKPENLTDKQQSTLSELLKANLKSVRAYLLKEDFQLFWNYNHPTWAGKFLDAWCTRVMRSKIEPLKVKAKTFRKYRHLILNWFRAKKQISNGIVEGLNNKTKVTIRKSYGFRKPETLKIALFHNLGHLPQPVMTHRFW